jgi:hypothetical protein
MRTHRRVFAALSLGLLSLAYPPLAPSAAPIQKDGRKPDAPAIDRKDKEEDQAKKNGKDSDKAEDTGPSTDDPENTLKMSAGVICRSIDGYEAYEPLPGAALTADEKLLVYYRPEGYKSALVNGFYQAHFTQDAQIRKRGEKSVLRQKKNLLDYKPRNPSPPQNIFLRNSISLKGLPPGDYDFVIILRDEVAKCRAATQVVKFKVVPAQDPRKAAEASPASDRPKSP